MNKRLYAALIVAAMTGCASYHAHDETDSIQLARRACPTGNMSLSTTMFPSWEYASLRMATLATSSDFSIRSASTPATSPLRFRHRAARLACDE